MEKKKRPFWRAPSRPWLCFLLSMQTRQTHKHNLSFNFVLSGNADLPLSMVPFFCFFSPSPCGYLHAALCMSVCVRTCVRIPALSLSSLLTKATF